MSHFPILPVLEELKKHFNKKVDYRNVYVISVQHILETTGSLFEAMIGVGIKASNIYLLGKLYSSHTETKNSLKQIGINIFENRPIEDFGRVREYLKKDIAYVWDFLRQKLKVGDVIIILDDGGLAIKTAPKELFDVCKFYGIEQTTFGLRYQENKDHFPIIQVATSATKKFLEPVLISKTLMTRIKILLRTIKPLNIGVIGFGNIGKSVAKELSADYKVQVFDINNAQTQDIKSNIKICSDVNELISNSDLIIGATGVDISKNWDLIIEKNVTLISVSSADIEFNSLLKKYNEQLKLKKYTPLDDFEIILANGNKISIIRGGTVANFNNLKESCPKDKIQITRGLLFAAILQALNNNLHITDENGSVKLKPSFQKIIVQKWFSEHPRFRSFYPKILIDNFASEAWISENSGGK